MHPRSPCSMPGFCPWCHNGYTKNCHANPWDEWVTSRHSWFSLNPACYHCMVCSHVAKCCKVMRILTNLCHYVCRGRAIHASILRVTNESHERQMWDKWHKWKTNEKQMKQEESEEKSWFRTAVWITLTRDGCGMLWYIGTMNMVYWVYWVCGKE